MKTRYIGIDIGASFFDVYIPNPSEKSSTQTYKNIELGWHAFLERLSQEDICVVEATGVYHLGLCLYLHENGKSVSVVNPLKVKHFARMQMLRAKTDKVDCKLLSEFGALIQPDLWKPKEKQLIDLQQLTALYKQLVKQKTALINQLKSVKRVPCFNQKVVDLLTKQINELLLDIEVVNREIQQILQAHYAALNKCLLSIPGIGPKTATALILMTEGFTKFKHYKALIAYVGLAPRTYQSGTSVKGIAHICKLGAKDLRTLLYECAHSAKRFNPICKKLFDRLYHEKKKPFKVAMIAVANKLIKIAFAIAVSRQDFDPKYQIAK